MFLGVMPARANVVSFSAGLGVCCGRGERALSVLPPALCPRLCLGASHRSGQCSQLWMHIGITQELLRSAQTHAPSPKILIHLVEGGGVGICNFKISPGDSKGQPMWGSPDLEGLIEFGGHFPALLHSPFCNLGGRIPLFIVMRVRSVSGGLSAQNTCAKSLWNLRPLVWIASISCFFLQLVFPGLPKPIFGNPAFCTP